MAKRRLHPTRAELGILRVLWREGPLSVRAVQNILNESKATGYTSVLKTMQIMADKGLVERDETQRPQIYRPRYSEDRTQKQLLTDVIQRTKPVFDNATPSGNAAMAEVLARLFHLTGKDAYRTHAEALFRAL